MKLYMSSSENYCDTDYLTYTAMHQGIPSTYSPKHTKTTQHKQKNQTTNNGPKQASIYVHKQFYYEPVSRIYTLCRCLVRCWNEFTRLQIKRCTINDIHQSRIIVGSVKIQCYPFIITDGNLNIKLKSHFLTKENNGWFIIITSLVQ